MKHISKNVKNEIFKMREAGLKRPVIARKLNLPLTRVINVIDYALKHNQLSNVNKSYNNLSANELLEEVSKYIVRDTAPYGLISKVYRELGGWNNALNQLGIAHNTGGTVNPDKSMLLYLIDFGEFKKYGVTQQALKKRFYGSPSYQVLDEFETDVSDALMLEKVIKVNVSPNKVIPSHPWFERNGKTECFTGDNISLHSLV